jgi:toxin ParE1/3/4
MARPLPLDGALAGGATAEAGEPEDVDNERFFDTALAALRAIEASPGLGSPRVGELVGINGLRRIGIDGFPCGWIHLERAEFVDVIRLLADRQDLAVALGTTDQD